MSEEMKEWAHMWGAKVNICYFLNEDPKPNVTVIHTFSFL